MTDTTRYTHVTEVTCPAEQARMRARAALAIADAVAALPRDVAADLLIAALVEQAPAPGTDPDETWLAGLPKYLDQAIVEATTRRERQRARRRARKQEKK